MKFTQVTFRVVQVGSDVTLYYVALDNRGRAWWYDTKQPEPRWSPLPPPPETRRVFRRRRR